MQGKLHGVSRYKSYAMQHLKGGEVVLRASGSVFSEVAQLRQGKGGRHDDVVVQHVVLQQGKGGGVEVEHWSEKAARSSFMSAAKWWRCYFFFSSIWQKSRISCSEVAVTS